MVGACHSLFSQTLEEWKTLDTTVFSIQYPADWILDLSGAQGTTFILSPPASKRNDGFQENINLNSQNLSEYGLDLDSYANLIFGQLRQRIAGFQVVSMDKNNAASPPYYKMIYQAEQDGHELQLEQFYWMVDGEAFLLTFTAEREKFPNAQLLCEKIMSTFTIK